MSRTDATPANAPRLVILNADDDDPLRSQFLEHTSKAERNGIVTVWYPELLDVGTHWHKEVLRHALEADAVVVLLSASFNASEPYQRVLDDVMRHPDARPRVIPVLVRLCLWDPSDFDDEPLAPRGSTAVIDAADRDTAWTDVLEELLRRIACPSPLKARSRPKPRPLYVSEEARRLGEQLEEVRATKKSLEAAGGDVTQLTSLILALRRQIREGGRISPGDTFGDGRYQVIEKLGEGGYGTVWKAWDRTDRVPVAIKVLHAQKAGDAQSRDRFRRGADALAALKHEYIVRLRSGIAEDGGYWYFVMEYVPGGNLHQGVMAKKLDLAAIFDVILKVGAALSAAHKRKFVHRDVKPTNILLDDAGAPRITDFDLVYNPDTTGGTRTGVGAYVYSPPELHWSTDQDSDKVEREEMQHHPRLDVFSLGMTLVFALRGKDPTFEMTRDESKVVRDLPCSADVKRVLRKAVAWNPRKRYSSMSLFCSELHAALERAPRRRVAMAVYATVGTVFAGGVLAGGLLPAFRPDASGDSGGPEQAATLSSALAEPVGGPATAPAPDPAPSPSVAVSPVRGPFLAMAGGAVSTSATGGPAPTGSVAVSATAKGAVPAASMAVTGGAAGSVKGGEGATKGPASSATEKDRGAGEGEDSEAADRPLQKPGTDRLFAGPQGGGP